MINTLRAVPPGRNVEEVTGFVARRMLREFWNIFYHFQNSETVLLINPVIRHWHPR